MNASLAYQAQQAAHNQAQADAADDEAFRCELDILGFRNEIGEIKNQLAEREAQISMEARLLKWEKDGKNYVRRELTTNESRRLGLLESSEKYLSNAGMELSEILEEIDAFLSPADDAGEVSGISDEPFEERLIPLWHVIAPEMIENAFQIFENVADCILESDEGSRVAVSSISDNLSEEDLQELAQRYEAALIDAHIVMPFENPFRLVKQAGTLVVELF